MLSSPNSLEQVTATATKKGAFRYQVYGLNVKSELELPELTPAVFRDADVEINFGEVPRALENTIEEARWCMASDNEFLFNIEGVARYLVKAGSIVTVAPHAGSDFGLVPIADVRLWLLGSAFAAVLHQRGLLPLHVSAIEAPTGAWAFTGQSGEGKSTLAGFLRFKKEWELISDDVSVVKPSKESTAIYPGPRKLKLWADAIDYLDIEGIATLRDLSNTEKFQLYMPEEKECAFSKLRAIVVLESSRRGEGSLVRMAGAEAFAACSNAIYRPYLSTWFRRPECRMTEIAALCQSVEVYKFSRPRSLDHYEHHLEPLIALMNGDTWKCSR